MMLLEEKSESMRGILDAQESGHEKTNSSLTLAPPCGLRDIKKLMRKPALKNEPGNGASVRYA